MVSFSESPEAYDSHDMATYLQSQVKKFVKIWWFDLLALTKILRWLIHF